MVSQTMSHTPPDSNPDESLAPTANPPPSVCLGDVDAWVASAKAGQMSWSELAERLLQLEHAPQAADCPDPDRVRRCGFGEVIYGSGKSASTIEQIANQLLDNNQSEVLTTRVDESLFEQLKGRFPASRYCQLGKTLRVSREPIAEVRPLPCPAPLGRIGIVTAGSTDSNVGHEALETLRWMGVDALFVRDVGVAGPYRILPHLQRLRACAALVVVAGMEGALASVVGGLVPCPIIAVPTSVGYGANLQGVTTLLSMLSSCAAGVTVVNIDAGFKGGYIAGLIAHQVATQRAAES